MADEPIDLIRIEGDGNTFVVQIQGVSPSGTGLLQGEIRIGTGFVAGTLPVWLDRDQVDAWRDALDALDQGGDVVWISESRGPRVALRQEPFGRVAVTVEDPAGSLVTVTVAVPVHDDWFDDAYDRLDRVWRKWFEAERT